MLEWVVSSSVLIAVVVLLRFALRGKLSLRLQYALWALVLLRLLIPVSFGGTAISVGNLTRHAVETEPARLISALSETELPRMSYSAAYQEVAKEYAGKGVQIEDIPHSEYVETIDYEVMDRMNGELSIGEVVQIIWLCGIVSVGVWFVISNLRLAVKLKKTRVPVQRDGCKLPIYVSEAVDAPCLFGLFHPAVYLTYEAMEDEQTARHAIEHELTHCQHKDNIWAILRGLCLAVHWYNPLVWFAAILSRNDGELACDASTILRLGESERAAYGRTLLRLTCEKRPALLNTATTMTGSGRSIQERIARIVKEPKMALYTVIAVAVIAAAAVGCTFTGALPEDAEPQGTIPEPDMPATASLVDDAYEMALPLLDSIADRQADNTISKDTAQEIPGKLQYDIEFPVKGMDWLVNVTYVRDSAESEWIFSTAKALTYALPSSETIQQVINSILVGALSYDETWQSSGSCTITVSGTDGRTDSYVCTPGTFYSLMSTPGYYAAEMYDWTLTDDGWHDDLENRYALTVANERYSVTVYSDERKMKIQETGGIAMYFLGAPRTEDGDAPIHGYERLFLHFQQYAMQALEEYERYTCSVDGSETDYSVIARELSEQYARMILQRPPWYPQRAQDAKVKASDVFDAYYGEDNPNFCFGMGLYLDIPEEQTLYWQAGAGLSDPPSNGEFAGYYGYGSEVTVHRGEDGRWRMTGFASGDVWADLPIPPEEADAQQLMELFFLTSGQSRDWRILSALAEKPLEEINAQLDTLDAQQLNELISGIRRFTEDYPDAHTWSPEDF